MPPRQEVLLMEGTSFMDTLTKQQATAQAMLKRDRLRVYIFFLLWVVLLVGMRDHTREFWIMVVLLGAFHGHSAYRWLRSRNWALTLNKSCNGGETALTVVCVKTRLITHKDSKYSPRRLEVVQLISDNKEAFLYILPEPVVYNGQVKETVNGSCIGRYTHIVCYSGTKIVKEITHLAPEDMTWE